MASFVQLSIELLTASACRKDDAILNEKYAINLWFSNFSNFLYNTELKLKHNNF